MRVLGHKSAGKKRCGTCEKPFVPPSKPALNKNWKPKAWHEAGFCSKKCQQDVADKKICGGCAKPFVLPKPNPLAKKQRPAKAWHLAGFCSKKCQQKPERDLRGKAASVTGDTIGAPCPSGHDNELPESHAGFYFVCGQCQARSHAPA